MTDNYENEMMNHEAQEINTHPAQENAQFTTGSMPGDYRENIQTDIPKWNPEPNEYISKEMPKKNKKKKSRIVPVLAVIIAILVAAVAVMVFINYKYRNLNAENSTQAANAAVISTTDTTGSDNSSKLSNGYVLTDVSSVVEEVMPSVVGITSRTIVNYYKNNFGGFEDIWSYFFGYGGGRDFFGNNGNGGYGNEDYETGEGQEVDSGLGSGTIISKNDTELLILTSYHVVEDCSSLYVTFTDENAVDGYVKAASEENDIAVVAVPLADIPEETMNSIKIATLSLADVNVGEGCIVIGNALGYGMSVTTGIISAIDRDLTIEDRTISLIQTDAAINNGNSGGCMLNARGEVIGISEAKLIDSAVEGMCYAIPVSSNSELIESLLNGSEENINPDEEPQGAYLGIKGKDLTKDLAAKYGMPQGIYVAGTVIGSGAEKAGLKEGDIIVGIDNISSLTMTSLQEQLAKHNPGDEVVLVIMRQNNNRYKEMEVKVELTEIIS